MRLLYLSRACNIHDLRFLEAFATHGAWPGFLSLHERGVAASVDVLPRSVCDLGTLRLPPHADTETLDSAVPAFRAAVRAFGPDVMIAGPVHDGGYVVAQSGPTIPWLVQCWAFDVLWEVERDAESLERARIVLAEAPALFADSRAILRRCESLGGRSFTDSFVLPWGIDLALTACTRPRETVRSEYGIGEEFVFVFARGLEDIYGIDLLMESFRSLHEGGASAVLWMASSGSLQPRVQAWLMGQSPRLRSRVRLLGSVPHERLLELLMAADCYISTALSDGTSITLLEAMYLGATPIVSHVGGNPEWVIDGVNGMLARAGDASAFASAMCRVMLLTREERERIARLNRQAITARADWRSNMRSLCSRLSCLRR